MNVVGHGIDVVDLGTFRRWYEDPNGRFLSRCFVQTELEEIGDGANQVERLAGRFAAKEAVLKAIGTGFGAGIAFTDVVIHRVTDGAPKVQLAGGAEKVAKKLGVTGWHLSITHTGGIAMASVIALGTVI